MIRKFFPFVFFFAIANALAWQTYVPPPPPRLPETLSKELVEKGKTLFEKNLYVIDGVEIYNYLGPNACSSCHDKPTALNSKDLAGKFKDLKGIINMEIVKKSGGTELPPQDPALEALVQYLISRYKLRDYKLLK